VIILEKRKYAMVYTREFEKLDYGENHPFNKSRFIKTFHLFKEKIPRLEIIAPKSFDFTYIERIHDIRYIKRVKKLSEKGSGYLSIDTPVFPGIFDWAITYCWASLTAVDLVSSSNYNVVFNPCGGLHHARKDSDGGFCVFNDVALAALYLHEKRVRVAIVDIDAHAGDGTMHILYDKPILKISIHEDPHFLYPGDGFVEQVGFGDGYGYTINVPLPPGSADNILEKAFDKIVKTALVKYSPQIIILQSGVDGYKADPLTHLRYSAHGYRTVANTLRGLSDRIVMLGGGGYSMYTHFLWATIFTTLIDEFSFIKSEIMKIDPTPTKSDEYLIKQADKVISNILNNHPFFTEI